LNATIEANLSMNEIINEAIKIIEDFKDKGYLILGIPQHNLIPDELIYAAGFFPLHLTLVGKDQQEIGDEFLSPTTCPYSRATIGFLIEKHDLYSKIDFLLTGPFCNGVQNIGNYSEYYEIKTIPFIVPYSKTQQSFEFYINELNRLKLKLEEISSNKINESYLKDIINKYNKIRSLFREINKYRQINPSKITGTELYYLIHQFFICGPDFVIEKLQDFRNNINYREEILTNKRVFLTGSGICLGDNFYEFIEKECGGLVVGEDMWSGYDFYRTDVEISDNLIINLAKKYFLDCINGRMVPDPRIKYIFKFYKESNANGIIYHILKYCDSYSGLKNEFKMSILNKNIPILEIERDYAELNKGQLKTRIEAFLEMIS